MRTTCPHPPQMASAQAANCTKFTQKKSTYPNLSTTDQVSVRQESCCCQRISYLKSFALQPMRLKSVSFTFHVRDLYIFSFDSQTRILEACSLLSHAPLCIPGLATLPQNPAASAIHLLAADHDRSSLYVHAWDPNQQLPELLTVC